jgi:hypothetical protein
MADEARLTMFPMKLQLKTILNSKILLPVDRRSNIKNEKDVTANSLKLKCATNYKRNCQRQSRRQIFFRVDNHGACMQITHPTVCLLQESNIA